jgi:hypothetical protein
MSSKDLASIVYEDVAGRSSLPVRSAAAVVIHNEARHVLIARRNISVEEFPGVWSFPSAYEYNGRDAVDRLCTMVEEEFSLKLSGARLIARRMAARPRWRILMHLYLADYIGVPRISGKKYDCIRWIDGQHILAMPGAGKMGDCMKAYRDWQNAETR